MSEKKDLYKVLGMAPDATNPEIKKAYLAKVKIFFPDRAPEGKKDEYTAIFIEIKEAVDILTDPQKRKDYDRSRADDTSKGKPSKPPVKPPPQRPASQQSERPATEARSKPKQPSAASSSKPQPSPVRPGPSRLPVTQPASWQPSQKAKPTYTSPSAQPRAAPSMSAPTSYGPTWTANDFMNAAQAKMNPSSQINHPHGWSAMRPNRQQQEQHRPPPPPPPQSYPTQSASSTQNGQVNILTKHWGRYYPNRDPEHLEYKDLPMFAGSIKMPLDKTQMDILRLMVIAHRYNLNVVELPFLVPKYKDRFGFDWGQQRGPFGRVEVILDKPKQSANDYIAYQSTKAHKNSREEMIPDYYEILGIKPDADEGQIRQAYKKQSLLTHPDRIKNATEAQRLEATKKFQTVADAYYVLSDPGRRRAYDAQRPSRHDYASGSGGGFPGGFYDNSDSASANFFQSFFSKGGPGSDFADEDVRSDDSEEGDTSARPNADHVFGDVFEELLRPEVERVMPFWRWIGAASGAALGFIAGNLPGAAIGAYSGGKLGAIRDAKGKAVVAVFKDLGGDQRAAIISALLKKVVGSVTSM